MRTLSINAKCSDMCALEFIDTEKDIKIEKHGYVPRNLGIGGADYICITIDMDSGKILNWQFLENDQIIEEL